ncbi:ubiquitin carboxyl-terminal hydrolase 12A-like isoform X2 [Pleurodeles waltl]|uniref:ubiquitin carboxyl-terminal hydrolase 12A-like isoform X2 n=1 Tax=Pleurodeles waltl TaxID=8319 RepID=UPI003709A957
MATFHRDGTSVDNTASANDSEPKSASQASSNFTTYFGLQNEGNTCFLNSLLQCLYLTPEFKKLSRCESECGETLSEIKKIFNALQKKKSVSTSKLAACLGLKPFKQQDVPEVFHLLLNKLDHELSNGLLFKKLYESTMVSLTECTQCVKKDGLHIGCNIVILPLPVSSLRNGEQCCSVTDALEHFLRSSEMKGENQMYCSDCREKTDATLRQALTRLPRILVVQLKRFDFSFYEQRFVKLDNAMHINTTLEVPCEMELQKDKKSYDLFAICDHYGGFKSGHYSAIIKPEENDKWFRFDDSIVTSEEILDPEREKSLRGKSSGEKYDLSRSRTAYVLMYRQKLEREPQKSAPFPTDLWTPQPSGLPQDTPTSPSSQGPMVSQHTQETTGPATTATCTTNTMPSLEIPVATVVCEPAPGTSQSATADNTGPPPLRRRRTMTTAEQQAVKACLHNTNRGPTATGSAPAKRTIKED